jgi:histone H3/H4
MASEMDIIKLNTLKRYIWDVQKLRVSGTSADDLRVKGNKILKDIIAVASDLAREDKRDTIMPRDTDPAIEQILGNQDLKAGDLFKEIKKLNPIELGELSKMITAYIQEEKESKN